MRLGPEILKKKVIAASRAIVVAVSIVGGQAVAGSFEFWDGDAEWQLQATYANAFRLHDPDQRLINSPPSPDVPLPDFLKVPESNNYDDGNRNFKQGSLVNNRLTLLGEILYTRDDYGLLVRGDAFYDDAYRHGNDNDSPDTINKSEGAVDRFSKSARKFSGQRARLLDAYVYGTFSIGEDERELNVRIGKQVVAWGESLFFSGVSLAQGPADATKATVPGADVKSILLPVNQISMNFQLAQNITLLGQYKLEYKETELNPVGEYFSIADVVGPGREFIYGIKNPFFFETLSGANLAGRDISDTIDLIDRLALNDALPDAIADGLGTLLNALDPTLPNVTLPNLNALTVPGTPKYINVQYAGDIKPSDFGQYGLGIKYQLTSDTNLSLYHLRYHNTTPAPVQNYGPSVLIPGDGVQPEVTTAVLGVSPPTTYNVRYFDGIQMTAMSFSTALFGANIAGEVIFRDGADVLVDVPHPLFGPVPTPSRARMMQYDLNGLYIIGPGAFWDAITIVADAGFLHVISVDEATGVDPEQSFTGLTNSRDASAFTTLVIIDKRNIFDGWDLQIPVSYGIAISGHAALGGAFGSLMGEGDQRFGFSLNFTRLAKLTLGLNYSGFFGKPDFSEHPYADRDNAGVTATYRF